MAIAHLPRRRHEALRRTAIPTRTPRSSRSARAASCVAVADGHRRLRGRRGRAARVRWRATRRPLDRARRRATRELAAPGARARARGREPRHLRRERGRRAGRAARDHARPRARAAQPRASCSRGDRRQPPLPRRGGGRARARARAGDEDRLPRRQPTRVREDLAAHHARSASSRSPALRAVVLVTDGLTERGIGVDEPRRARWRRRCAVAAETARARARSWSRAPSPSARSRPTAATAPATTSPCAVLWLSE